VIVYSWNNPWRW